VSYYPYAYYYPFWWPAPYSIHYYDNDPFYFHSGFNIFFGGDAFYINIGNIPPPGYLYFDPYCSVPFANVGLYHEHIDHHHHPALIRVMVDREYASRPSYGYYHDGNYYETYKQ
jgi:hypothetical protein